MAKTTSYSEYPLYNHKGCPTARYVGGVSVYLCECIKPHECVGWLASKAAGAEVWTTRISMGSRKRR